MPAKKNTTFKTADKRGLLDQDRKDGKKDKKGKPLKERKPLHERRRTLARVGREEISKKLKNSKRSDDIEKEDLVDAEDIAAEDQARAENMGRVRDWIGTTRTPSPQGKKSGITLSLKKRKRDEDVVDEETAGFQEPMEDPFPAFPSLAARPPPTKKPKTGGEDPELILHVKIVDFGLSAPDAASLALPRELELRVPRRSGKKELVPLLETALQGEEQQEGRSLRSGKKGKEGKGWAWRIWVWDGEEFDELSKGLSLAPLVEVGSEGPLRVEGRVSGVQVVGVWGWCTVVWAGAVAVVIDLWAKGANFEAGPGQDRPLDDSRPQG